MDEGLMGKVAEWSENKISDEQLCQAVEEARPALEQHLTGFEQVVSELNQAQLQHCDELITFCRQMFADISESAELIVKWVKEEDRNQVFIAGDSIGRATFQLNQAFSEFRNQALVSLGPTDIPNYNLLISRRDDYLDDPSENNRILFSEAVDGERVVVYHSLEDLAQEERTPEVESLINAFRDHMACLNDLAEAVAQKSSEGLTEIFEELDKTFQNLRELVPTVTMKIRGTGDTDFPDINHLIKLMEDVAQGNLGDQPLLQALESIDESFAETKEQLEAVEGKLPSALANEELEAISETFEELDDGVEAVYKFLEERDRDWLVEAKGCFLEFAGRLSGHQKKLKEIESNQGKLLCPMCSESNDQTRTRCSKCGGPLPQNVAAQATSTFESRENPQAEVFVTANLEKLYQAVNEVAAGTLDGASFLDAVDHFEQIIEANIGSLPPEPQLPADEQQQEVEKVYDVFEEGVEALRSGLDTMRSYLDTEDEEVLAKGVTLIDEGARKLAAAGEAAGK